MKVQAVLPKVSSDDKHEIKEVKTTLNLYEKLAEQKQKEQNEELDDSLSCAVLHKYMYHHRQREWIQTENGNNKMNVLFFERS